MATSFTRQMGNEPNVQLNPTIDNSEGFAVDAVADQMVGVVARVPRGPIDRAFEVHKGNVYKVLGMPEPVSLNELNTAHAQIVEMVTKGAKRVVVSRLVPAGYVNQYVHFACDSSSGAVRATLSENNSFQAGDILVLKHHGCFNDGIKFEIFAKEVRNDSDEQVPATNITLKVMDAKGVLIDEFSGSLSKESRDDDGYPNDIASFILKYSGDDYEAYLPDNAQIPVNSNAYGKDSNGKQKTFVSEVLKAAKENGISVGNVEYKAAVKRLKDTQSDYVYLASLGSKSTALCAELAQLAYDKNIQVGIDVPSNLTPKQAITWVNQLGIQSHLVSLLWHPVECNDPSGVSGRVQMATSGLRAALHCARNASINALGFAAKQYAIAGKRYPIQRQGMKQLYKPDQEELSDLAKAGITPVIFESFTNGSAYIFADAITKAGKETSYLNLISSTEIITTLERDVSRMAKEFLQFMPMEEAVITAKRMIGAHFDSAYNSKWIVDSDVLGGKAWELEVRANAQRPNDTMNIRFGVRPEGCLRRIYVQCEVSR